MKKEIIYGLGVYLLATALIWIYFGWNDAVFIMLLSISWIPIALFAMSLDKLGIYYAKLKNKYLNWRMSQFFKEFENENKKREQNK